MTEKDTMLANFQPSAKPLRAVAIATLLLALAGCDQLGIETADKIAEKKDAEGRAIGSACRYSLRSIEDCYDNNPKASKSSVHAGWREMDGYMRENNINGMAADKTKPAPAAPAPDTKAAEGKKDNH